MGHRSSGTETAVMATPAMAQMATTAMIIFCIKIPPSAALRTVFLFTDSIADTEPRERKDMDVSHFFRERSSVNKEFAAQHHADQIGKTFGHSLF